jgi:RNA polymerase sigma-70 factor (ECF subfamily)
VNDETPDALMARMRPRLHRYCARMVGSAFDGEDVVQEALARAAVAYGPDVTQPERWLMRIAHNAALDALRRRRRQAEHQAEAEMETIPDPTSRADARIAAEASLAAFLALPPLPRSMVIFADVLGDALSEATELLGVTEAAGKAALHRGRAALRERAHDAAPAQPFSPAEKARLRDYADRFNARDFDALRALLAEDVRLNLANRVRLEGRASVSVYFGRYGARTDYRLSLCRAEGQLCLLIEDDEAGDYVVRLGWRGGEIVAIDDYRYAPYVAEAQAVERLD